MHGTADRGAGESQLHKPTPSAVYSATLVRVLLSPLSPIFLFILGDWEMKDLFTFKLILFFQHHLQEFIFFPKNYLKSLEAVWSSQNLPPSHCPLSWCWCVPTAVNKCWEDIAPASGGDVQ